MTVLAGDDPAAIEHAADRLAAGALVAFPTETVYGLGARADDDSAVARIFAAKGRPADHPLIVHVASIESALHFAPQFGAAARALMAALWPGPLTVIVPRHPARAAAAAGGQPSIGLRMPAHPVALALLRACAARGVAGLAAPSANRFGRVSPTTAAHVAAEFGAELLVLDGGACAVGIESAIIDCTGEPPARAALLRPGQIGRARIEAVLGAPLAAPAARAPRASGTLEAHYAPRAPVRLFARDELAARVAAPPPPMPAGAWVAVYSRLVPAAGWHHRPMPDDAAAAARELFAVLRAFDDQGVAAIWVEQPPAQPSWEGVHDRLRRAAASAPAVGCDEP